MYINIHKRIIFIFIKEKVINLLVINIKQKKKEKPSQFLQKKIYIFEFNGMINCTRNKKKF